MSTIMTKSLLARAASAALVMALCAVAAPAVAQQEDAPATEGAEASAEEDEDMSSRARKLTERMQTFYDATTDFQAGFKQTYTDLAAGESKVNYGVVYMLKPGMMRWDYREDGDITKAMIADGEAFWIYEVEFNQVFKQCLAESKLPASVSFLMGEGDLLETFDISMGPNSTEAHPELVLVPKVPTSKYKELRFVLDAETAQVLKTTIYDPYGNTNEIVFSKVKFNKNLKKKSFQFTPPKNARLLNPQKEC